MNFKKSLMLFGAILVSFAASSAQAQYLSIGVGVPVYRPIRYYRPYVRPYYPYRYWAYMPVPVAPLRGYIALPPVYYPQPAPELQTQFYGYPPPSATQPYMSASPIPNTLPTPIPAPPPELPTPPPSITPPPPPAMPPLIPPPPESIPALPDQSTGTAF